MELQLRADSTACLHPDSLALTDEIVKKWFVDYANPTGKELAIWTQDLNAFEPSQDWDLMVGTLSNICDLAALSCIDSPNREYIVHYLHVATADAYEFSPKLISEAIVKIPEGTFQDVLEWRDKARCLVEHPKSYNEKDWVNDMQNRGAD